MTISFKKFLADTELQAASNSEQLDELFGVFTNNKKIERIKAEREKLKNIDPKKKAALDKALADFAAGRHPGKINDADLADYVDGADRKAISKADRIRTMS